LYEKSAVKKLYLTADLADWGYRRFSPVWAGEYRDYTVRLWLLPYPIPT